MPPRARATDPQTSHDAAASVKNISETQKVILKFLEHMGPRSDEDLYRMYITLHNRASNLKRVSPSGLRTRRKELQEKGLIRDSGKRGKTVGGRSCILWELNGPTDEAGTPKLF